MSDDILSFHTRRYFASSVGAALPLKLISEIGPEAIQNRNTYFIGFFDDSGRLLGFDKMVYGERAAFHRYEYASEGVLKRAVLLPEGDDEERALEFDESGRPLA